MESSLTKLEMDAVLQLIQLRGNPAHDFHVFWVDFCGEKEEESEEIGEEDVEENREENKEESVGESWNNPEKMVSEEALPRRRKKLRPIVDIYRETQPLIRNKRRKI